jgi:hypothetical protein
VDCLKMGGEMLLGINPSPKSSFMGGTSSTSHSQW